MHFKLNKYLIEQSVKFLRRVLTYNSKWDNLGIEQIQVASGSSLVYEHFAWESEKYPIIVVSTGGGNYTRPSFNDLWKVVDDDRFILGKRPLTYVEVNNLNDLIVPINYRDLIGNTIRGIEVVVSLTERNLDEESLVVQVYKDSSLISSGSLTNIKGMNSYFSEFSNSFEIQKNSDYYLKFLTQDNSSYYIMIDSDFNGNYQYNNATRSGSIVGSLYFPACIRLGGTFESSLQFSVQAKNDTATVYNLTELISIYFTLAKYCQVSRASDAINGLKLSQADINNIVSEFTEKGIFIKGISQGPINSRRRGDKDIIFFSTITVNFYTEWYEDYPLSTIRSIEVDAKTFNENLLFY